MTPVYPENTEVTVTVPLPVYAGAPLIPSAVTRTVKDQAGVILSPSEAVTIPGDLEDNFPVTIPAALNALEGRRGARIIDIEFVTTKGTFSVQSLYLVEAPEQLIRLENSFVTAGEAMMTRRDMPALDGWDAATDTDRNAALITAHRTLCKHTYRYKNERAVLQSRVTWGEPEYEGYVYIVDIESLTEGEWEEIPVLVREAIQRAQMAEADVLLRGDPVGDKRRAGIVSETTGESSMEFRQTPEVRMGMSREAIEHVGKYLYRTTRIARA